MTPIPDKYLDLVTKKVTFANLATIQPDGTPQVTPVWFDFHEGKIRINTARGRVKDRNMSKNANVAMSISDPENPYRHIQIRGKIVGSTETGADAFIDALAKKYMGVDKYPYANPAEKRVTYSIEPTSVSVMG